MSEYAGWLLDFGGDIRAAVGEFNLVQLVHQPDLFAIPGTPRHCSQVLPWQAGLLPVWDLRSWLEPRPGEDNAPASIVGVVGYQRRKAGTPVYGAFPLSRPPSRIVVRDVDACAMPGDPAGWRDAALACVEYAGVPLPILDLRRIFSDALAAGRPAVG